MRDNYSDEQWDEIFRRKDGNAVFEALISGQSEEEKQHSRAMGDALTKGTIHNAAIAARNQGPDTEDIYNPHNWPIYDFYMEDGRTGYSHGPNALEELLAMGQAVVVKQRPGTGKLIGQI